MSTISTDMPKDLFQTWQPPPQPKSPHVRSLHCPWLAKVKMDGIPWNIL